MCRENFLKNFNDIFKTIIIAYTAALDHRQQKDIQEDRSYGNLSPRTGRHLAAQLTGMESPHMLPTPIAAPQMLGQAKQTMLMNFKINTGFVFNIDFITITVIFSTIAVARHHDPYHHCRTAVNIIFCDHHINDTTPVIIVIIAFIITYRHYLLHHYLLFVLTDF